MLTLLLEVEIIKLFYKYMLDIDFLRMFLSGLFYSAIIAFVFGVWINKRINSLKSESDRNKVQSLLKEELVNFYNLFKNLPDDAAF